MEWIKNVTMSSGPEKHLLLLSGPTGSGKSTIFYNACRNLKVDYIEDDLYKSQRKGIEKSIVSGFLPLTLKEKNFSKKTVLFFDNLSTDDLENLINYFVYRITDDSLLLPVVMSFTGEVSKKQIDFMKNVLSHVIFTISLNPVSKTLVTKCLNHFGLSNNAILNGDLRASLVDAFFTRNFFSSPDDRDDDHGFYRKAGHVLHGKGMINIDCGDDKVLEILQYNSPCFVTDIENLLFVFEQFSRFGALFWIERNFEEQLMLPIKALSLSSFKKHSFTSIEKPPFLPFNPKKNTRDKLLVSQINMSLRKRKS